MTAIGMQTSLLCSKSAWYYSIDCSYTRKYGTEFRFSQSSSNAWSMWSSKHHRNNASRYSTYSTWYLV